MKYVLEVCLIAFTAGTPAPATAAQSPALQKGISVELAPTHNATSIPNADREDAFIVAVTADGSIYLGVNPVTLRELAEKTRTTPFKRDQAVYIKADARTPYATVLQVLEATDSRGMIPQVLLTSQSEPTPSDTPVPPQGLVVSSKSAFPSGTVATVVQLLPSAQDHPLLKINNDETSWSALEETLRRHFQKGDDKVVLLRVGGTLPFAEVVHAFDSCRAVGAKVYLPESEQ